MKINFVTHFECQLQNKDYLNSFFEKISKPSLIIILLLHFALLGLSQSECGTIPTTTYYNNNLAGMAVGTYDDPITIRLYVHVVREDNGSGGLSPASLATQINELDEIYNRRNIFFDYCISDFPCTLCAEDVVELIPYWTTHSLDDGINLYLFDYFNTPGSGQADDVGSKSCFARGDNTSPAHEIGHCLGLFHTHQNMECPATNISENAPTIVNSLVVPGANCATAGDLLCDTPADPKYGGCPNDFDGPNCTFINPNNVLDYLGNPYIDPDDVIPSNIMSYRGCVRLFSDQQNMRMRDMLASDLSEVVSSFSHISKVTGTETWNTPMHFNHDVTVTGDLTISTQIYFAPGFGIVLDGDLEINEGLLDVSPNENTCLDNGRFWKGIFASRQSEIRLYDSEIKNAELAVTFTGSGTSNIKADGVIFKNNQTSFKSVHSISGAAEFVNCDFIIDDQYLGNSYFSQVELINCSPTSFGNCDFLFQSELSDAYSRQGISNYNSQIIVLADSDFENWTEAIQVYFNRGTKLCIVNEANFEDNKHGIYANDYFRVITSESEFNISNDVISADGWGMYCTQSKFAELHHNEILSNNSSVNSVGIHMDNTGATNLALLENVFSGLDIGFNGQGNGNYLHGLRFLCNSNSSNRDFDFKTDHGIGPIHGSMSKSAGNTFSHAEPLGESDFKTSNFTYDVEYYYANGVNLETPLYFSSNVFPDGAPPQSCAFSNLISDPYEGEDLDDFIELHELFLEDIDDKDDDIGIATTPEEIRELTADLHLLWLGRDQNIRDAVSFTLVQDTIDYNDVRAAIGLESGFIPEVAKAFTYLDQGRDSIFLSQLGTVNLRATLTSEEDNDLDSLILLNELLVRVYSEGRFEGDLTSNEIDTVEIIADRVEGLSTNQAKSLLEYFYGYNFTIIPFAVIPGNTISPVAIENLVTYPNPVDEIINVHLPDDVYAGLVKVSDVSGTIVQELKLNNPNSRLITLNTASLPSGVYLIQIINQAGKHLSTKFIK